MREDSTAYNAAEIIALHNELIGPVERERLQKALPWVRSLVNELIQRIANLRTMAAEPDPAARIAEMEQKEFTQEMWNLTQSEVGALQSQVEQLREALQLIANSFDTRPIVEVKKIARAALDAIRQQDTEKGEK